MNVKTETELHRRLVAHRGEHPECDRHCPVYFDIARRATEARTIREGTINIAHSWLSVREATVF